MIAESAANMQTAAGAVGVVITEQPSDSNDSRLHFKHEP